MTRSTNTSGNDAPASTRRQAVAAGLANGACLLPDVATAGQPRAEHFAALADAGYRTVIDLRHPDEARGFDEAAAARAAGLRYENIPVTAATLGAPEFDRFRALLREPDVRPALVHCASANRVGALLIPYLVLDERRTLDEALAIADEAGLRSHELAEIALRYTRAHEG